MSKPRESGGSRGALREYIGAVFGLVILLPLAIIVGIVKRRVLRRT